MIYNKPTLRQFIARWHNMSLPAKGYIMHELHAVRNQCEEFGPEYYSGHSNESHKFISELLLVLGDETAKVRRYP